MVSVPAYSVVGDGVGYALLKLTSQFLEPEVAKRPSNNTRERHRCSLGQTLKEMDGCTLPPAVVFYHEWFESSYTVTISVSFD